MPQCAARGAELEPPVRVPHTVYVKSLYWIGGQNYCRHHIIKAAVAAGVIVEVKAGSGPGTVLRWEACSGDPSRSWVRVSTLPVLT